MFFYCISKAKNEFGQHPEENIILTGPGGIIFYHKKLLMLYVDRILNTAIY